MLGIEKLVKVFGDRNEVFELIVRNSPIMIFINDVEGNYIYSNKLDIIGYTEADLVNHDVFSFIHPDDKKHVRDKLDNIQPGVIIKNIEYRYLHKNGEYIHLSSDIILIEDNEGNAKGVLSCTRDITQTIKLIKELSESEEKFRKLFENSNDAIFWSDVETGIIINCNTRAVELLEKSKETIIGQHHSSIHPKRDRSISIEQLKKSIELKSRTRENEFILTNSGKEVPVQITSSVIELKNQVIVQGIVKDISKRKAWEELIKESEKKYRSLFELTNAGICLSTFDGIIRESNAAWTNILGYSYEELRELNLEIVFTSPTKREKLIEILKQKGQIRHFETQIKTKGNMIKWISLTSRILRIANEDLILSIITDIDKKILLEKELKDNQVQALEQYQSFFVNNVGEFYWIEMRNPVSIKLSAEEQVDEIFKEAYVYDVSDQTVENFGYSSRGEMVGTLITDLWPKETYKRGGLTHNRFLDIIKNGYQSKQKLITIKRQGKMTWLIASTQYIIENDCIVRMWGSQFDVTKQKLAEKEVLQSNTRYQSLFKNMIDGFAYHRIILEDGKPIDYEFIDINEAFTNLTGITREMVIGKRVTEALPGIENDPANWIGRYGDIALNQKSVYFESKSENLAKTFLVHAYSPEKGYFVTIFTDISDRIKAEEEQLRLLKIESLSLLAGGIAHDYNNLLVGILSNVNLMQLKSNLDTDLKNSLEEIEKATFRATDLTKQLLTFSKGGAPITKPESIKNIIEDSISLVLRGSKSKPQIIYADPLPIVQVDAGQIHQLINNIVINADQSMPFGGTIRIEVEGVNVSSESKLPLKEGGYVKISIRDTGFGIHEKILPKIFDPYFTTKTSGSGLGLASSHSIVDRHHGYITALSDEGKGSTFIIYLPTSETIELIKEENVQTKNGFDGRVLVMDDEASIRKTMREVLIHLGFTVDLVEDGQRAIELYAKSIEENDPYGLVIMDLTVPGGMGGREALTKLLRIDSNINAIVSSGYSTDPVLSNFEKYGFKGRLLKPYTIEQLKQVIARCLKLKNVESREIF